VHFGSILNAIAGCGSQAAACSVSFNNIIQQQPIPSFIGIIGPVRGGLHQGWRNLV